MITAEGDALRKHLIPIVLLLATSASLSYGESMDLETIVDEVANRHMDEKQIPGLSVAVVHEQKLVFSKGYGLASVEFNVPATEDTVYPISSVSKMFAGLLAMRLVDAGALNLDASITDYVDDLSADKGAISIRHLLQHTHGLDDYYFSDAYATETGKSIKNSSTQELLGWSLNRPLKTVPGESWAYSLAGYTLLGQILADVGGASYANLVAQHVLEPLGMTGTWGGSDVLIPGRNPVLYELIDGVVSGHVVDFPEDSWPAGGMNMSVTEMAKLFAAISGDEFLDTDAKQQLWRNAALSDGKSTHYGLGWFSYVTSKNRWVVGHEGGGASWVVYYPDIDLAVIALSNMSGARADGLPYEIARAAFDNGWFERR